MTATAAWFLALSLSATGLAIGVTGLQLVRARRRELAHFHDLDTLLLGMERVPGSQEHDLGDLVCALTAELADATVAVLLCSVDHVNSMRGAFGLHGPLPMPPTADVHAIEQSLADGRVRSAPLLVPVVAGRRVLGVVYLPTPRRALDAGAIAALALAGRQFGPALDAARLHHHDEVVHVDPVTGVWGEQECFAMMDELDVGDAVALVALSSVPSPKAKGNLLLAALAASLRASVRPTDEVARYGNAGFLLVLRDLRAPVDHVLGRILGEWAPPVGAPELVVGAALHVDGSTGLHTLELAKEAMSAVHGSGRAVA